MTMTTRKRHNPEQVVRKLATADRMLGEGKDLRTRSAVSRQRYGRGTRYCFTQPVVRQGVTMIVKCSFKCDLKSLNRHLHQPVAVFDT